MTGQNMKNIMKYAGLGLMWTHPHLFPEVSPAFLAWRLVAQDARLAIIWWSMRPETALPQQIG